VDVLFLDQFSEPGGAQQCLLDLLPAVIAHGWRAVVAAPGDGWLAQRAVAVGAKFHRIRCGPFHSGRKSLADILRFLRQSRGLRREIASLPADLIYVNGPRLLPSVPRGRPVIFHCHSFLGTRHTTWLAGRSMRRTDATLIAACRFVLKPLRHFALRAHIVYNGVAPMAFAIGPPRQPGPEFRIGMIGRIAPQKGQAEFLRAARHLRDCRITICGEPLFGDAGYFDEIRALAEGLPVEFLGWQLDPARVLSRLDLLLVPSTVPEATPRVILEAFAAGVPVLASACGGIPELIRRNHTGFLIESPAPEALARQIRDLAAQPELRDTVAAKAHRAWREHYTLAEYQRRILSIMETAGASARR
jgi:glycosyltransferase involved in cell wall biosynthesis